MKTIDEAAKEYAEDVTATHREFAANNFIRGVEFAQRWIPVEEELPEDNFVETGMQFGFDLLVTFPNGRISLVDRLWSEAMQDYYWRYKDGSRVYEVKSWRPIELK